MTLSISARIFLRRMTRVTMYREGISESIKSLIISNDSWVFEPRTGCSVCLAISRPIQNTWSYLQSQNNVRPRWSKACHGMLHRYPGFIHTSIFCIYSFTYLAIPCFVRKISLHLWMSLYISCVQAIGNSNAHSTACKIQLCKNMSIANCFCMFGFWILTATSVPSFSVAQWTCAIEAIDYLVSHMGILTGEWKRKIHPSSDFLMQGSSWFK